MKKKGFTLIELLGVIVLIGIISLIVIPPINSVINKGAKLSDEQLKENIILAAKNWASDHKDLLEKEIGLSTGVYLTELQNLGYIEKNIKLPSNKSLIENVCVEIKNIQDNPTNLYDYIYEGNCNNELPSCKITLNGIEYSQDKKDYWFNNETTSVTVALNTSENSEVYDLVSNNTTPSYNNTSSEVINSDVTGLIYTGYVRNNKGSAFCSAIVNYDKTSPTCDGQTGGNTTWKNSGTVSVGAKCTDAGGSGCTKDIFTTNISGQGQTQSQTITIKDKAGNTQDCTYTYNKYIDTTAPTCDGQTGGNTTWKNSGTVSVGAKCADTGGSGCAAETFTANISGQGQTQSQTIKIKDKAGNTQNCTYTYNKYIDTTAPTCNGQTGGKTNWTKNQNVSVGAKCTDTGGSGCTTETFTTNISGQGQTQNQTITIKDNAGNTRNCTYTYNKYIDTTNPTLTVTLNRSDNNASISLTYGSWINSNIIRKMIPTDTGGSGIDHTEWSTDNKTWNTEGNVASHTFTQGTHNEYYRTIDKVGNISNVVHVNVKNDTEAPKADKIYKKKVSGTYGKRFGYYFTDNLSGFKPIGSGSKFEYCIVTQAKSQCGMLMCSKGFYTAKNDSSNFTTGATASHLIYGKTSTECSTKARARYTICDVAGNCLTKTVDYSNW